MKMKILLKLIIILLTLPALVLADFGAGTNIGTGVCYSSIVLGDIDNDGDLDLIVTGQDVNYKIRLDKYINTGADSFIKYTNFGTGVNDSSIALGDIDNDGDLDLIVTGYDGSVRRLDKYINDGSGNFTGPVSFGTGVNTSSIALGDIDNDGDLDLIVTGYDGSSRRLDKYINDGSGIFTKYTNWGTGVNLSSIVLGDIDNDGDLDLIVAGYDGSSGRLDKYINIGSGNFTKTNIGVGVQRASIALGDIDNDGDLDLIVTGSGGSSDRLDKYINDGAGSFSVLTNFGTGVWYSSIALGDINNDGYLDLIVTGKDFNVNPRLDKYINNGTGNFTKYTNWGTEVYWSSIALGDINNDGDLDLIVSGIKTNLNYRLDMYRNLETNENNPPDIPTGMTTIDVAGYWRFKWNPSSDDHTKTNMLRYKVAYGTNSGVYNLSSTNIDYPRGQANLGNVCIVTAEYYQSKVPVTKNVYWKVCSIDSAFKHSAYCAEQSSQTESKTKSTLPILNTIKAEDIQIIGSSEEGYKGVFVPEEGKTLNLKLNGVINDKVNFKIFTLTGEKIYEENILCDSSGTFKLKIPTDIASGIYIIRVESSKFTFTKKLPILK